jgi:hypothetical protein
MKVFVATVHIVLPPSITEEAEACDAISEMLSHNLQFGGHILDWAHRQDAAGEHPLPEEIEVPDEYFEGAFLAYPSFQHWRPKADG